MTNFLSSQFSPAVLPCTSSIDAAAALPLDKRLVGERNRTAVLSWVTRFGWLTSRMVAALVWADAAQSLTMARRTLKGLCDEKLLVARSLSKGGAAYVMSARGARLLQESAGIDAKSGHALAIGNPLHRACSNWYLIQALQRGLSVVTEHEIASGRGPCRVLHGKVADGLVIADDGACVWVVRALAESPGRAAQDGCSGSRLHRRRAPGRTSPGAVAGARSGGRYERVSPSVDGSVISGSLSSWAGPR